MDPPIISEAWRALNATQRDIVVTIAVCGPASGAELHTRRGHRPKTEPTTHRNLAALREAGYVETQEHNGRESINQLTLEGEKLVDRAVVDVADRIREVDT